MALISKSCEYGLRAVLYMAARKGGGAVPIRTISEELDISFHFLTKILQRLAKKGLVVSSRGPRGGVALAVPARRIALMDVIRAIEGRDVLGDCILGLGGCGRKKPCPLHRQWARERAGIEAMFVRTTLAKLAGHMKDGRLRLAD